jgi:hypothetical protein
MTLRHALNRTSYLTSMARDLILQHMGALSKKQILHMRAEVVQALEERENRGAWLGDKIEHQQWKMFVNDLEKRGSWR